MRRAARSLVAGCLLLTALTAAQAASADGPTDLHAPPDAVQVLPQPPAAGDVLSLKVTARNGSTRPVFNVQARVFLRRNGQDTRLADVNLGTVGARGAASGTAEWAWDTQGLSGPQTLIVQIDPDDRIQVGDENAANNVAQVTIALAPRPADEQGAQWQSVETRCCTLHYLSGTAVARDIDALRAEADAAADDVAQRLGVPLARRLDIYLVPRTIGHGGYAAGYLVISVHDRHYPAGRLRQVLRHEIAHAAQDTWAPGGSITMMAEGLAVWVTGGHFKPEPVRERAAALLRLNRYTPFAQLVNDFYQKQHELGYLEAASFVAYLHDTYGMDSLRQIFGNLRRQLNANDLTALNAALTQVLGKGTDALEGEYRTWLEATPRDARQERDVALTADFFDTVRRYQQALDPTAYFLTPWLPNIQEAERRGLVADYMRHPEGDANLALETLLLSTAEAQYVGDYDSMEEGLRVVKDILAQHTSLPDTPWPDLFGDPLASAHLQITRLLMARGYEAQRIEVEGDSAVIWATRGREDMLYRLSAHRADEGWRLWEWVYRGVPDTV